VRLKFGRKRANQAKLLVLDRNTFVTVVSECDLVSEQIADLARRRLMSMRLAEVLPQLSQQIEKTKIAPNSLCCSAVEEFQKSSSGQY
jgi:hypothetical protein